MNDQLTGAGKSNEFSKSALALAGKYLTFRLGDEEYGVEILKVREIIGVQDVTPVPQTAGFVMGVINLRGKVIPIIDLRLRFALDFRESDDRTCIIVVEIEERETQSLMMMGIVVDQVSEVINVQAEEVEPPPTFGVALDTGYILGMAKAADTVKILLDIDKVLGDQKLVV